MTDTEAPLQLAGVTIEAPETPGHYSVELTLVQKGYVWFDQLDPDARATIDLYVEATDS